LKILVYGDSFAAPGITESQPGWTEMLARKMGVNILNKAVNGGSTEKAFINFAEDIKSNTVDDDDIIVFIKSTPGRCHFLFQNEHPETASMILHPHMMNEDMYPWYRKNRKLFRWYMENRDFRVTQLAHESYIHVLMNYARAKPKSRVFLLHNHRNHGFDIPKPEPTSNFLEPDTCIHAISCNEWQGDIDYWKFVKNTLSDPRQNHLCNPNLEILSDLAKESLMSGKTDNFSYDLFQKNLYGPILSIPSYEEWIKRGYMYDYPFMRERLQKNSFSSYFEF